VLLPTKLIKTVIQVNKNIFDSTTFTATPIGMAMTYGHLVTVNDNELWILDFLVFYTSSYLTQLGEGFANGLELPFVMVLTFGGLVCCKLYTKDQSKPNFPQQNEASKSVNN
jgi:hypothetical protein